MTADVLLQSESAILFIGELSLEHLGRSVRTIGFVRGTQDEPALKGGGDDEAGDRCLFVEFKGTRMRVDAELIHPDIHFDEGYLYQFIGELVSIHASVPVLRARVIRCIEGLDFGLYEQAVTLFRQHVLNGQLRWPKEK